MNTHSCALYFAMKSAVSLTYVTCVWSHTVAVPGCPDSMMREHIEGRHVEVRQTNGQLTSSRTLADYHKIDDYNMVVVSSLIVYFEDGRPLGVNEMRSVSP